MDNSKLFFLIEDDVDDQEIFLMALEDLDPDIPCYVANDGVEALEKLQSAVAPVPSHIFIDLNMPRMNGVECLKEIKKLQHLKTAKIIMYSTSSEAIFINQCIQLGADDFIVKPPSLTILTENISRLLK